MNKAVTTRQQLIRTSHDMFMRLGIKSISMDDIAREMGVSKKTIYVEVSNKEELIQLVMEDEYQEDMRTLAKNREEAVDAMDEFLRNSRYFIRQMRAMSPATLRDLKKYYPVIWKGLVQNHHLEFSKSLAANLERGLEEGIYRDDLDPLVIARFYSSMMMSVIDTNVFPARERPISDIISQLSRYHFHGIVNQFGRERLDKYLNKEALE
ncbi:TetR/AcrR family transcriptional regulator [Neolewinella persica]|uniref:TetR/AcrR family transcriptional regulator n=1 Tax=Neolewinella persica TaxID=70998 RepID=UPI0022287704|nr:TetR/AcrR family transcriptional regulator [Neolewinella persica]